MPLDTDSVHDFHPAVADGFRHPFPAQAAAWPMIRTGQHTLVAAPSDSGKTLGAFLAAIDALIREDLAHAGTPPEAIAPLCAVRRSRVVYRDGMPIAALVVGEPVALIELTAADLQQARHALLQHAPASTPAPHSPITHRPA